MADPDLIKQRKNILLLTLRTFSLTGGVEKVSKGIAYHLNQLHHQKDINFRMISFYDDYVDEKYVNKDLFSGYNAKFIPALWNAFKNGIKSDIILLSHINLAPVAVLIKLFFPKKRIIVWTHGIEVWRPINNIKKLLLKTSDRIVAVSHYTAESLVKWHHINSKKTEVIANALDPFFHIPEIKSSTFLTKKYNVPDEVPIFMALTRLKLSEQNKNYDKVIRLLGELKKEGKPAYYILCGKYEEQEASRIKKIVKDADMEQEVILTGFVPDEEITHYYLSADAFVLPSMKEGFGLVFIEAQACGLKVLAGNQDGSTEAVRNPQAGILINPQDDEALKTALISLMIRKTTLTEKQQIQQHCINDFGFQRFAEDLNNIILN